MKSPSKAKNKKPNMSFVLRLIRFMFFSLGPVFPNYFANRGFSLPHRISTVHNVKTLSNDALVIHDEDDTDLGWQCGKNVADACLMQNLLKPVVWATAG